MRVGRGGHAAIRMAGGGILVTAGASATGPLASTEVFDPRRGRFRPGPVLTRARVGHTATRLIDGRILVVGGYGADGRAVGPAELLEPRRGRWETVTGPERPRGKHAAIRLRDGRVLVVGGSTDEESRERLASTEVFDPRTATFSPGPRLRSARYKLPGAVALLTDGRVIVAGDGASVELVDVGRRRVTIARGRLDAARAFATLTPLPGGLLLLAGGYDDRIRVSATSHLVHQRA